MSSKVQLMRLLIVSNVVKGADDINVYSRKAIFAAQCKSNPGR